MEYRIGMGYDIHRLAAGRKLYLGGIEVPYLRGLLGHSDADALLHAIIDALLGAAGCGDIGEQFPDTDPKYHNAPSAELLRSTGLLIGQKGYKISNIDATVVSEEPKLTPFKKKMREKIAEALSMKEDDISIKAKTNEGLGEVGRKDAIASYAVAIITK